MVLLLSNLSIASLSALLLLLHVDQGAGAPSNRMTRSISRPTAGPAAMTPACLQRRVHNGPPDADGTAFSFPTILSAKPARSTISACIQLEGLAQPLQLRPDRGGLSVNDGAFTSGFVAVRAGDRIRYRIDASAQADATVVGHLRTSHSGTFADFAVRTENRDRAPRHFRVGAGGDAEQLSAIADALRAGDVVELSAATHYGPVVLTRSGTPDFPIIIRGASENGRRPVLSGGAHTIRFEQANYVTLESVEVTGGSESCVRIMGDHVVLRDVYVHDCERHGILGADLYAGNILLDGVEVSRAGSQRPGENTKHPIYIATDYHRFPGAVLRVQFSYIHDFLGGGIKSRAERFECYYNTIDALAQQDTLYTLEIYGFESYQEHEPLNSDVVGNVLIHRGQRGIRLGGDGTGASRGRVRLANNTFVFSEHFSGPVIRLYDALDSLYLINNAFVRLRSSLAPLKLFRNDIAPDHWTSGSIKIGGRRNWYPAGTDVSPAGAAWDDNINGATPPGLAAVASYSELDLAPLPGSPLLAQGGSLGETPPGFEVPAPLTRLEYAPLPSPPLTGAPLPRRKRTTQSASIGAL